MPGESAQMFHLLRGQMLRPMRKPLVIFMSKRLLRFKGAMSELSQFSEGEFRPVINDPLARDPAQVKQVILCSGQVYYDALEARRQRGLDEQVAMVRVEKLYPFPTDELSTLLAAWRHCSQWVWLQEEPENQAHGGRSVMSWRRWRWITRPGAMWGVLLLPRRRRATAAYISSRLTTF
jgi:2-oxoglutarate dehydrogenase E1 component